MPIRVDAVVVGLGPGGEDVAGRLAEAGLDVVGVEERLVGGECPYWGCIPSKIMVRAANLIAEGHRIPGMAGTAMVHPDWKPVARSVREATDGWDDKVAVDRLVARGGHFLRGHARITAPDEVTVHDPGNWETVLRPTRAIVLAVGSEPAIPPIPGLAGTPFWTNREAIAAQELPHSMIVLGGGSVGLELGQAYARFGTAVTVIERGPRLLPSEEPEASELLLRCLGDSGLDVHTDADVCETVYDGHAFTLRCSNGDHFTAEKLLVATGRRVDLGKLGAGVLGVDTAARVLPVDERLRVVPAVGRRPGVWALGDVTGKGAYTHISMYQADLVVNAILGQGGPIATYHAVPRVTFTDPEVGAVGLTEAQARESGIHVRTGLADVATSSRGFIYRRGNQGFLKLVADADAGSLVGATSAGPTGGEVLGALSLAVHARIPLDVLRETIWAFPTFHRVIGDAVGALSAGQG